tara:strand:- start:2378 stop:3040 length:663 start_codon:yes stop_codon:yes gene_type:complete
MQLSEFTYVFLILCVPFIGYIVNTTNPKKGFTILFSSIIFLAVFINPSIFTFLGILFLGLYAKLLDKKESNYLLLLSTISFLIGSFNFVGLELLKAILPILLVSSVFSLMMIGHWFLVDPTISRVGMKNIAIFSTSLSLGLSVLVFFNFYESSSNLFNLLSNSVLNNVIVFLYISAAILSFGSFKSLQEKSYTGVMASTGLSYLSLIVSMGSSGTLILSI